MYGVTSSSLFLVIRVGVLLLVGSVALTALSHVSEVSATDGECEISAVRDMCSGGYVITCLEDTGGPGCNCPAQDCDGSEFCYPPDC